MSYLGFAFLLLARHSHKTGSVSALASFVSWPSAFFLLARYSPEQARSPPSLLLNESVLCLVVVWVDSLQPEGAFMSLTAKLHKILD